MNYQLLRRWHSARLLIATWLLTLVPHLFALNVSEPPAVFSTSTPGSNYNLTIGTNVFSGIVSTPSDAQNDFRVTVPARTRMTLATKNFVGGGNVVSPNCEFNDEDLSGTGTGTFVMGYPLSAGTYQASISVGFSTNNAWTNTFVVGPLPDYSVTTTSGQITITENYGNANTLNLTNPSNGNIVFNATGRSFTVNNGPLITNSSGSFSLIGVSDIVVDPGNGSNTLNISGLPVTLFPNIEIYGGTNSSTLNFSGTITLGSGNYFDVEYLNSGTNPDSVTLAPGANLITSGDGSITIYCNEFIQMGSGSGLLVQDGDLDIEANQQTPGTPGNFTGINLDGANIESTGLGDITVDGQGGTDSGGYQLGVQVINGGRITGSASGLVTVNGAGGNSAGEVNRGVTVYGAGSAITSVGGPVSVTGNAGTNGSYYGIGISVIYGAQISAGGTGAVMVNGTGAGQVGSGYDQGLELGATGSLITSSGGDLTIYGAAGPGGSYGIYLANGGDIITPLAGGDIFLYSDSDSWDSTTSINTTNPASFVQFGVQTFGHLVDLGGADAADTSTTLILTPAEINQIITKNLFIGYNSGGVAISAPITQSYATNLTIIPGLFGTLQPLVNGTDITLANNGTVAVNFGTISFPITGPTPNTGYPELKIAGRVHLNSPALNLTNSTYSGNAGDIFTLIDATSPITGTFANLPEGSYVSVNGQPAVIHYAGGAGNDVVLVRVNPLTATGGITNGVWRFSGVGVESNRYTIQATTNFINWTNIGFATGNLAGAFSFADSNAFRFNYRFYRTTN